MEELSLLEQETIKKYDSYLNGYNETLGGEGSARYFFTFEEYCFIKIGNTSFEGMFNQTAYYFGCDNSVISDIVHNITYLQYLQKFNDLNEEIKNNIYKILFQNLKLIF